MKNETKIDGVALLRSISQRQQDPEGAKNSFALFASYFEPKVMKYAEIQAHKMGLSDDDAFEAVQCAFAKVWSYPSFNKEKSHCKKEENGIIVWLKKIIASQLFEYSKKGVCYQQNEEEDLSVIEDSVSFVDYCCVDGTTEEKIEYVQQLESVISKLGEKHKIVFLTYRAYESNGKKLPRKLLNKLRVRLGNISQTTIRVYKSEAYKALGLKTKN